MAEPIQFITILERNTKENEQFFYYCQWTGNEKKLKQIHDLISSANYEYYMGGDYITLSIDMTFIPESVVDINVKLFRNVNGYHRMFTKCTGTLSYDLDYNLDEIDEYECAKIINNTFYTCRLPHMFSDYRNPYRELLEGKISRDEYEKLDRDV